MSILAFGSALAMSLLTTSVLPAGVLEPSRVQEVSGEDPLFVRVFASGAEYASFRIPAMVVTSAGTVLTFAEGRVRPADHAENDLVLRRSLDGGETFGELEVIADVGADALNNPCVVQVQTGAHANRILLMYQRYPEGCGERCVSAGLEGRVCQTFLMHSDDDGRTWSNPRDITESVKPTGATSLASGPGNGIQKRRPPHVGRVLMPFNRGPYGAWKVFAAFSDDGGDHWVFGAEASDGETAGFGNEVQFVERVDGSVLLNARAQGGSKLRKVAASVDGGATWSALVDQPDLIEPQVMASVLRFSDPLDLDSAGNPRKSRLLYAGPESRSARENGTLKLSYDEGATWPVARTLYSGPYAYSALGRHGDRILVLFERDGYATICLARTSLDWLTRGSDSYAP